MSNPVWKLQAAEQSWPTEMFELECEACPRLAQFHRDNRAALPGHFNAPVPPFGKEDAGLLIVGLAPGLHGANRTGRPFTGDYCGDLLYQTLNKFGFANRPASVAVSDGFALTGARVSNAVKCVPPQNKPTPAEIKTCNRYLSWELSNRPPKVVLALGLVAHQAVLKARGFKQSACKFAHGAEHDLDGLSLIDSYHVSRYNTQTGRLTAPMFEQVVAKARAMLHE